MTERVLSVRLDAETATLLDRAARASHRRRSDVVRDALRAQLAHVEAPSPWEVAADRIGCADSGRDDLSTNASRIIKERLRARASRSR
jgi:predicted transcriptional regulator